MGLFIKLNQDEKRDYLKKFLGEDILIGDGDKKKKSEIEEKVEKIQEEIIENQEKIQLEKEYILQSPEDTKKFAKQVIESFDIDTIVLTGELASGKTKFVEGILEKYDLQDEISSPTFTIVNEYNVINEKFDKIYHLDVYRLRRS